ncbi:hypothetical protein HMN09_00674300 [Mycena chlorophos]|uniref:Mid2 domain-containing protein n=1 Tax=Mycena chlorophos TaxID=658473 RepID=A0A8H6W744_MYCCL|nr:hypothetical protein HMN09_00674300 [Mycena chlorophos]
MPAPRCRSVAATAATLGILSVAVSGAQTTDFLACNGTGMDWYKEMVGETPCQTYQSLRQICNPEYQVGLQSVNTPPDECSDQVSECCCNNVAFALSMLCLNCQQNIGTGSGIDAGVGAYADYLGTCNSTTAVVGLPSDIQTAVCNQKIKIDDDLYTNGWPDGAWFYVFTSETIVKDNAAAGNNSFTHCASTTLNQTSSSTSPSKSKTSSTSSASSTSVNDTATKHKSKIGGGAAAGIAIGAVAVIAAAFAAWLFCFHKRRKPQRAGVLEEPLGGTSMREREREQADHDPSLAPTSYPYSDNPNASSGSYFAGPRSDAGGSATSAGFAGLGAAATGGAVGPLYSPYSDSQSMHSNSASASASGSASVSANNPLTPRRGFHTAGQASAGSSSDLHGAGPGVAAYGMAAGEQPRGQAGPLPRKRRPGAPSPGIGERQPSAEPFLEADEHADSDMAVGSVRSLGELSERHTDAGPVRSVSLGRSPSGRLPPAYGEQTYSP